jgi:hypothetical protein
VTAQLPGVQVTRSRLPAAPPAHDYDLLVLSEVLYYLPDDEREQTLRCAEQATVPGADLVVVHWRHHSSDTFASGASVNRAVRSRRGWRSLVRYNESDFVLDVLTRTGIDE